MATPAIVIVAFNRPKALRRLLSSLTYASYPPAEIPLVISVDHQDSDSNRQVRQIAEDYEWRSGSKEVVISSSNLGLRRHVLQCGDLVGKYGAIIMLEDDLFVSPHFYEYAVAALTRFQQDVRVSGVSLYRHLSNPYLKIPFEIAPEGFDNFFLQFPSSWGQAWTRGQWEKFRGWYCDGNAVKMPKEIHPTVRNWPETSWLKHFLAYMVQTNTYFVYPSQSYTTNFSDSGTNVRTSNHAYQTPLMQRSKPLVLKSLEEVTNVFDSHFEILPEKLKALAQIRADVQFETDLYGSKDLDSFDAPYFLSSKYCKNPEQSFGLHLKPIFANIISQIDGDIFSLGKRDTFTDAKAPDHLLQPENWSFFRHPVAIKQLWRQFVFQIRQRFDRSQ